MAERQYTKVLHVRSTHPETFRVGDAVKCIYDTGLLEPRDQGTVKTLFTLDLGHGHTERWAGVQITTGTFAGQGMEIPLRQLTHVNRDDLPPCRTKGYCPYTGRE